MQNEDYEQNYDRYQTADDGSLNSETITDNYQKNRNIVYMFPEIARFLYSPLWKLMKEKKKLNQKFC